MSKCPKIYPSMALDQLVLDVDEKTSVYLTVTEAGYLRDMINRSIEFINERKTLQQNDK